MSEASKQIGKSLRRIQDMLAQCAPSIERDALQARFDLTIDRFRQVPDRVMMQFDANTIADGVELDATYTFELLWALSALEGG